MGRGQAPIRNSLGAALLLACSSAALEAAADAYRYTDERGGIHFTDNPAAVPPRFRDVAERIETRETAPPPQPAAGSEGWLPSWSVPEELAESRMRAGAEGRILPADQERMQQWLDTWGMAFVIASIPWGLITLGTSLDALLRRRFVWAVSNMLLWLVSVPIYVVARLDELGMPQRLGLLVLWMAPFVVGALALRAGMQTFTGAG